jgi:3'-5' exoribonuclease
VEFSGIENTEYGKKGQLLGHLVMGGYDVMDEAKELGYENSEEALLLEHMIISHHGQPQFGACKKPQTAEALLLWYIDSLDSKLRTLGEQFEKTENNTFTDPIAALEKTKFYKHD